jgi:hypothetical protein
LRILIFLALLASQVCAQGLNGSVTGIVVDPSGAVIAGAEVSLTSLESNQTTRLATNASGVFRFASAPIGAYRLQVASSGFKTYVRDKLTLETAQILRIDVTMELGAAQESVSVTAEAAELDRETSVVGTQISREMVSTLPFQLTGSIRNPFSFVRLTPGAQGQSGAADGIRIAGSRTYANEVFMDGTPFSYNPAQNVAGPAAPALETVAEFRVEAALPPAEFGRTAGGAVLMASRSGGNEFHGNLFLLMRNGILDARRYNAAGADVTRQGEFGGSAGGPVLLPRLYNGRNRTFFFTNYTGFRRLNQVAGQTATLATDAMRHGDFSAATERIYDPLTANAAGVRQLFANNTIPVNRISPFALAFQKEIPLPNGSGLANNHLSGIPSLLNMNSYFIKLDHAVSDRHRLSGSFRDRREDRINSNGFVLPVSDRIKQSVYPKNIVLADDFIIKPTLVTRVQAGFNRFFSPLTESGDIGLKVPGAFESGFPGVRFQGQGLTGFGFGSDRNTANNNFDLGGSIAWTKSKHNFKFGGRFANFQMNQGTFGFREGQYTFSQFSTSQPQVARTGHAYASLLLGQVNSATMSLNAPVGDRSKYYGVFAQDDWKVTRRLTLNYGFRWEVQGPFYEAYRRMSNMDANVPNPGANGRLGAVVFAGDGPGRSGIGNFSFTDFRGYGPRLGLAYQLAKNTVVRAGAGIFYSPLIGLDNSKQGFNSSITVGSQDGGLTPVFLVDQGWPAELVKYPPFIDPTIANNQNATTTEFRHGGAGTLSPTTQLQFSLQQLVGGILLDASYVGTFSHRITTSALLNVNQLDTKYLALGSLLTRNISDPAVVAAGYRPPYESFRGTLAQSLRAFPQYQTITTMDSPAGNSTYHALFLKAEKRFARGLQFLASYAFTKAISDIAFMNVDLARPQDQYNRRAEKSLSDVDVPQRFNLSFTYELPAGKGKTFARSGVASAILGGWAVAGILSYESGGVIRVTTPNNLPIFNGHLRPNAVPGAVIRSDRTRGNFAPFNGLSGDRGDVLLNRDSFSIPAPFTLGTLGVALPSIRSFGNRGEDLSLIKRFPFRERRRAELRADFFNAFNHRNLNDPIADLSNPNFGRITGQGAARIIQLGFRAEF